MTRTRKVTTFALLSLPVVGLAYLAMGLCLALRVPDAASWQDAASTIRADWKAGDLVVFSPAWACEGAPLLSGLDVSLAEETDWYAASKKSRVWIIASPEAPDPDPPAGFESLDRREAGDLVVHLWAVRPTLGRLAYDFLDRIRDAKVTRVHKDRREECTTFKDRRWHCGAVHPWQFVGHSYLDVGGIVRDVIWAHPLDKGIPLEVRYPNIPMHGRLVVRYGLGQRAVDTGEGAPVRFEVRVGSAVVVDRTIDVEESRWYEEAVELDGRATGASDVTFTVSTPNYKDRQFCFTADVWAP